MTGLLITTTVASAQLCAVGLIAAAIYTSATEKRELTQKEAMTCGLIHETQAEKAKKKPVRRVKPTG